MSTSNITLSPQRQQWLLEQKRQKLGVICCKVGLLVFFIVLWEIAANLLWIDPFITSSPTRIIQCIARLMGKGELIKHVLTTTVEAVLGFTIGVCAGTLIAIVLWSSDFICKVLEPYLVILNALPKIALGPIFILWIGAGPEAIIAIAVSVSLVVTVLEVLNGFLLTDSDMIKLVKSLGANRLQVLNYVVLPANLTTIISSLKVSVGMSWVGVIVGEFLISKAGLGYLIVYGSQVFQLDLVMTSVFILCVVAGMMYCCIQWVERYFFRSREEG